MPVRVLFRGASLATTLMVAAVVVTLAFCLISLCLSHLQVTTRWSNAHQARNLAESMLSLASARVVSAPEFGAARSAHETLRISPAGGGEAVLTFDPDQAEREHLPWSTNNLQGESSVPGWEGQIVPGSAAHLVARATYRGVVRKMEAVVAVPAYPYVLASAGPFHSSGGLTVGSLTDPEDLNSGLDLSRLHKARLASNSVQPQAFNLGPGTSIVGDLSAVGGIVLDPQAIVKGQVREHAQAMTLPRMPLSDYDPARSGKPGVQHLAAPSNTDLVLEGYCRREGSLRVEGPLTLQGALLYVNGDLEVTGGIRGRGCLVVEGQTRLGGGSQLASDNVAALLSRGDVTLEGGGSFFQGLVYTEGNVTARDVTLLGTLIANTPAGSSLEPAVSLSNSTVVSSPRTARVVVPLQAETPNLFFTSRADHHDEDEDDHDEAGSGTVALVVRANSDGTYFVYDPALASLADHLTLAGAVEHIVGLLEAHYSWQVDARERERIWTRLRELTPQPGDSQATHQILTVDPNRFLSLKDKARILLWRPL